MSLEPNVDSLAFSKRTTQQARENHRVTNGQGRGKQPCSQSVFLIGSWLVSSSVILDWGNNFMPTLSPPQGYLAMS